MPGTLYLVATPIGNLQDMSQRALDTLRNVNLIACEDTRHTLKLLNHYRISNSLISYHEHNEQERAEDLTDRLVNGDSIAIVSDAGTPGICDPGFRIVQRAVEIGAAVVPIPGAVAFINAAAGSGLATDSIFFGGFLPSKKGDRRKRLEEIASIPATLVLYESPHRLVKSLADCLDVLGDRSAAVARELTKLHEEFTRGSLSEIATRFSERPVKGEIVLIIERGEKNGQQTASSVKDLAGLVSEFEAKGVDHKNALKKAAKVLGMSKSDAYRLLQIK